MSDKLWKNSTREILRGTTAALSMPAGESARFEAQQLLCHVLNTTLEQLALMLDDAFPSEKNKQLQTLVEARMRGEPLQYIIGEWEFMGLPFKVKRGVLIPRADTETLCETAVAAIRAKNYKTMLDICCGSGCIGVSVGCFTGINATLTDISDAALSLSQENAALNGVKCEFIKSDLFDTITGKFDLICCNPPYLTSAEMRELSNEVQNEPPLALDGGEDGFVFYRRIAAEYEKHLNPGGMLLLEVGYTQAADVLALFRKGKTMQDVNGIERVVLICEGGKE